MLALSFLQWWYSSGWKIFAQKISDGLHNVADFFSLGSLFRTLFAPYRQISAYSDGNAALDQRMRAFFDKLLSRAIGAVVRLLIIIAGIITMLVVVIFGGILCCIWPIIPLLPLAGIALTVLGVTL